MNNVNELLRCLEKYGYEYNNYNIYCKKQKTIKTEKEN